MTSHLNHLRPATIADAQISAAKHAILRDRLKAEFPDIDDETLFDTLEGISDLREQLVELLRSALEDQAYATALTQRMADMRDRQARLEERAQKKRQVVLKAMCEADIKKLVAADLTASVKIGQATLDVVAEEAIPAQFWKPQTPKLDRLGLIAALKAGFQTNAAKLADPVLQLSVRTK